MSRDSTDASQPKPYTEEAARSDSASTRHHHQNRSGDADRAKGAGVGCTSSFGPADGWDAPPPIASPINGQWQSRKFHWITPQKVSTLRAVATSGRGETSSSRDTDHPMLATTSCNPIIWDEKYIVLVTSTSKVLLFGDISCESSSSISSSVKEAAPFCSVQLDPGAVIVAAVVVSHDVLYLCSAEGHIYKLQLLNLQEQEQGQRMPSSTDNHALEHPCLVLQETWNTGSTGCTCLTSLVPDRLLIGYDDGNLEMWQSARRKRISQTVRPSSALKLIWRGILDAPVRSVSAMDLYTQQELNSNIAAGTPPDDTMKPPNADSKLATDEVTLPKHAPVNCSNEYIIVTLRRKPGTRQMSRTPSCMVEVLDLVTIESDWNERTRRKSDAILLHPHTILPTPGMEFNDTPTLPTTDNRSKPAESVFPRHGPGNLVSLGGLNGTDIGNFPAEKCALILSDGTAALLSCSQLRDRSRRISWGVEHECHQIFLSYPAVGCGQVEDEASNRMYFTCCLRGGTCYFVPVTLGGAVQSIPVLSVPRDPDRNFSAVYVQCFTSGKLCIKTGGQPNSVPVLVYGWAGGFLDVYTFNLGTHETETRCLSIQEEKYQSLNLLSVKVQTKVLHDASQCNDILQVLYNVLEVMGKNPNHALWQSKQWAEAQNEYHSFMTSSNQDSISTSVIDSENLSAMRRLLLMLAAEKT